MYSTTNNTPSQPLLTSTLSTYPSTYPLNLLPQPTFSTYPITYPINNLFAPSAASVSSSIGPSTDGKDESKGGSVVLDQASAQRQGLGPEVNSTFLQPENLDKSGVGESKGSNGHKLPTLNGQTYINHLTWREAGTTSAVGGNTPSPYNTSHNRCKANSTSQH